MVIFVIMSILPTVSLTSDESKKFLQENGFVFQTNKHDGGYSGFQNYVANGLKIKQRIIDIWRDIFVNREDDIYEIETPDLTMDKVLKRSGHIDRFNDLVLTYIENNQEITKRADHYIEACLAKSYDPETNMYNCKKTKSAGEMSADEIKEFIIGNKLIDGDFKIEPKNLMFKVDDSYLRPEIAQSMFVEFSEMYKHNGYTLPFGLAQVGKSYRNEISNSSFTRLRSFTQAEVEYFVNPQSKTVPIYDNSLSVPLLDQDRQEKNLDVIIMTIKEATDKNIISNHYIAMFISKLYEFALFLGIDADKIRFRQHMKDEMAHYAKECWDLEVKIDSQWLECAGLAYRGDYDLKAHCVDMVKDEDEEKYNDVYVISPKDIMAKYGLETGRLIMAEYKKNYENKIEIEAGNTFSEIELLGIKIPSSMFTYKGKNRVTKNYYPHVIEPSIGIDRVFFALMCHRLKKRESDTNRVVLTINDSLSPYEVMVAQLSKHKDLMPKTEEVIKILMKKGIRCFYDKSSTGIGKRYVRADQIGIPYTVTIDFETLKDDTVTVRNRDTTDQIRVKITDICKNISELF